MAGAPSFTPAVEASTGSDPVLFQKSRWGALGGCAWCFLESQILFFKMKE